MSVKVTIEGLAEVKTALRALPDATAKNVVRRVLRSRGEPIATRARRLVPVEEGELRDSIAVSTRLSRRQRARRRKFDPTISRSISAPARCRRRTCRNSEPSTAWRSRSCARPGMGASARCSRA
jgi:hypothetical protein